MLDKPSVKNINIEFIYSTKGGLDKFQKSLNSIITSIRILSNHDI